MRRKCRDPSTPLGAFVSTSICKLPVVRLLRPSSHDEMVLEFLRAEVDSPRFQQAFATLDRGLLTNRDPTDARQNALRSAALDQHRGVGCVSNWYTVCLVVRGGRASRVWEHQHHLGSAWSFAT